MKSRITPKFFLLICLLLFSTPTLQGCENVSKSKTNKTEATEASGLNVEKLLQYQNTLIGDSSAVGNIITALPLSEYNEKYELQTGTMPYEIILEMKELNKDNVSVTFEDSSTIKLEAPDVLLKNAVVMFSLITNADIITFKASDESSTGTVTYKREELPADFEDKFDNIAQSKASLEDFFKSEL